MQSVTDVVRLFCPLRDFLYILQLEEYDLWRYLKQVRLRICKRGFEKRDTLKRTTRMKITILLTMLLFSLYAYAVLLLPGMWGFLAIVFVPLLTPFIIFLSSLLVSTLVALQKRRVLNRTKAHMRDRYPHVQIIGITGSYGKTTVKYLLYELLKHRFETALIPENINTTLGTANYILQHDFPPTLEYLIVEMGAYTRGDIKEIASVLPPDIAILTKLGDQHLERFGGFTNLVLGKNEIFAHAPRAALKFTTEAALKILAEHNLPTEGITTVPSDDSAKDNITLAAAVAKHVGVSENSIEDTVEKFEMPERRDNSYTAGGVTVLDNSYNISPQTASSLLKGVRRQADADHKSLVVMTAGIAEQGAESDKVNKTFAEELNRYAHRVILHPSIYAPAMRTVLSIPIVEEEFALLVLENLPDFIDGQKEILLHLPEHGDLAYV